MLSNWLGKRYEALYEAFGQKPFRFNEAVLVLKEKTKDSDDQVNVILAELRKKKWLSVDFNPDDNRKRIYQLKSKEDLISHALSITNGQITRSELYGILKRAADLIRTRVDYSFILILLFYKRISDKWEIEYEDAHKEALEDGLNEKEAKEEAKNSIYHDFDIPEEYLWEQVRKDPARLPENFSKAMKAIAQRNPELRDAFENVDFVQFTSNLENTEILRQLVETFSARSLHHVSADILGDAYEWILRYFAPQKAKEGEVYTPREVINLLIEILDPKPNESVYDPAAGSGAMLISAFHHVENTQGKEAANKIFLFGQESNHRTLALAKMNVYIHDIRNTNLVHGDTLLYPKFKEGQALRKFDAVVANPPWNQYGYPEETLKKGEYWRERYNFGFTPKQSADWAWAQHMLKSAKDDSGRVGIVIDNGCLFRGGKEKAVRTTILNANLIESIILLPEKLFYNTGAPGAILIFNKNKLQERKDKILFINASKEFEQHPEVRKLNRLGTENIQKIVAACKDFSEEIGFSRIVDLDEIKENDYNLNVTLYVFPEEEIEEIDIEKEWQELAEIESELVENKEKIKTYLNQIK
ncbi:MAG: N-6 DNA methylase [Actinobacteria bacterium]|nr:N-6 DNA methylase [Actinomycetota bacterium]